MTTPDPIALPELPEGWVISGINYGSGAGISEGATLYTADDMRAYGQACVEALTPAPQVPEGMVLVPREPTPEMVEVICDRHAGKSVWPDDYGHPARAIRRHQAREGYRAMLAVAALNQPFGKPEELPLNEPSGNPGQLASLEQRAERLLQQARDGWFDASDTIPRAAALRAITAALSAQPRQVEPDGWEENFRYLLERCPHTIRHRQGGGAESLLHSAILTFTKMEQLIAAPQPREVRGGGEFGLGDHEDKALAWDSVCAALNTHAPGWANSEGKSGLQSAVDAIAALASGPDDGTPWVPELLEWLEAHGALPELPFTDYELIEALDKRFGNARATTPQDAAGVEEMSPDFTDSARAAIAWVLYHHQGGSSPVGQPLRFALGMGAHDPLPDWRIAEAKRYAEWAGASTERFHITPPPGVDVGKLRELVASWQSEAGTAQRDGQHGIYGGMSYCADSLLAIIDAAALGVQS